MGVGPRHHHLAGLQRLTQTVQGLGREFGQFIQEQYAVVGQGHLAGFHFQPAAGEGRHAGRMVRGAERPRAGQGAAGDQTGHRMHHRGLQQFDRRQRRQKARQALGHHRLARAGRPDEQQVVAAGGRDLQRALGGFLAAHVAQVERALAVDHRPRPGRGHHLGSSDVIDHADQRARGQDLGLARPGRLWPVGFRADQAEAQRIGRHRRRQGSGHRRDAAVQAELADRRPFLQRVHGQHAHGAHQPQRDGQVVVAAFLLGVGRGEIDHDALGQAEAEAGKGRPHALTALGHGLVGQAHDEEGAVHRTAVGDLDLDVHAPRFHPFEGDGDHSRHHAPDPLPLASSAKLCTR
jgi:hypothetical protein